MLEEKLHITFQCESTRYRSFYRADYSEGIQLLLQSNWDPIDSELMEDLYPHLHILLYVRSTVEHATLRQQLIVETHALLLEQRNEG